MKLALHACCGPCLLEPLDALAVEHDVVVVYANPNIHPVDEYDRRLDTLLTWARERDVEVVEVDYDPAAWADAVGGVAHDPALRCGACFRLRLAMTANVAKERGMDGVATTLSVSPYQDHDAIVEAGEAACADAGLAFVAKDFRDRYPEATRRSRELGMYRQNYCGCVISDVEARRQREERKRAKKAAGRT
jgi:predicted adenine nucleotide alpha hydrolase (AANH) superfamily ATPase